MASALTVLLLGCWLAGRSGVRGGGSEITPSGAELTPTCPDSDGSGELESQTPAPKGETGPVITGVSVAAIFLIGLVAFVCFRRTRARKGAALRPNSTSSLGALKTRAQQDPVYTSIDKGKEPQTLEPGTEGLTYAELDGRALQAKGGPPAPAAQTSLYAVINVSRGPPQ